MSQLRREVLRAFKKLHRTSQNIFQGDQRALTECRNQINDNFRKNKNEHSQSNIEAMIQLAKDVECELRTNVIQAKESEPGVFELRITEDTTRLDNVPFNADAEILPPRRSRKDTQTKDCCGGTQAK